MVLFNLESPPIQFLNTFAAILTAHVFYNTTIIIRVVSSSWQRAEHPPPAGSQGPWAPTHGRAFWEVTLPLLRPVHPGAAPCWSSCSISPVFGAVLMMGGSQFATLEVEIYIQALHMLNLPLAAVLSILQLLCTLIITVAHNRISGEIRLRDYFPVKRAHTPPPPQGMGTPDRRPPDRCPVHPSRCTACFSRVSLLRQAGSRTGVNAVKSGAGLTLQYYRELWINRLGSLFYVPPITAARKLVHLRLHHDLDHVAPGGPSLHMPLRQRDTGQQHPGPAAHAPPGCFCDHPGIWESSSYSTVRPFSEIDFPILLPHRAQPGRPALSWCATLSPALRSIPDSLRKRCPRPGCAAVPGLAGSGPAPAGAVRADRGYFLPSPSRWENSGRPRSSHARNIPPCLWAIYRYISQPGALNYGQALAMSTLLMLVCAGGILVIETHPAC